MENRVCLSLRLTSLAVSNGMLEELDWNRTWAKPALVLEMHDRG